MRVAAVLLALVAIADAAPRTIDGTVAATRARWSADAIVSEADVREPSGAITTVIQLGGAVDGIGMTFSHQPALLHAGDAVHAVADARPTATGQLALALTSVIRRPATARFAPGAPGSATYGVQRTTISGRPLHRDSGCIHVAYDASTVTAAEATALDLAFAAWTEATTSCGGLDIQRSYEPGLPSGHDGLTSVHVRRDTWCRPATASEPALCYSPDAVAVTRLVFVDNAFDRLDGKILEADMDINEVDYELVLPGVPVPAPTARPQMYFRAVTTHEAGHLLGLAHDCGTGLEDWPTDATGTAVAACDDASASVATATMFYAVGELDDGPSTLEPADLAGACEIAAPLACTEDVAGGCRAGHPTGPCTALLVLFLRRRRRFRGRLMW